jgi:hypothetical protein
MLFGSSDGLELNAHDVLPPIANLGDYSQCECAEVNQSKHWYSIERVRRSHPNGKDADVLLFADTMAQVLSGGLIPHVLHRVAPSLGSRINIVLEMRCSKPKRWYTFQPNDEELDALRANLNL